MEPDDILCISSGLSRRMATVTSDKKLSFPPEAVDFKSIRGNPMKVQVLKQVGKSYLVLKPREQQYKVVLSGGAEGQPEASCELLVQPRLGADGEALAAPAGGASSSSDAFPLDDAAAAAADDAKEYLEGHRVLPVMQALLHAVIKERPEDPFEYMARHFMSGYRHDDVRREAPLPPQLAEAPVEGLVEADAAPAEAALVEGAA